MLDVELMLNIKYYFKREEETLPISFTAVVKNRASDETQIMYFHSK